MTPKDKRRQRRKEKRVAEQPKLSPQQKAIIDAFEELDNAIKAVNKNFGRLAFVVDQQMLKDAGVTGQLQPDGSVDKTRPAHLKAVEDEAEDNPAAVIAAAQAALGEPKETVN